MKCHDSVGNSRIWTVRERSSQAESERSARDAPFPEEQARSNFGVRRESSPARFAPLKASRFRFFENGMDQVVP